MDVNHNKLINTLISLLYSVLKVDEHTTNSYNLTSAEWDSLYKLATTQGILAIVYDAVSQLPKEQQPPRHLKLQWALCSENIENRYRKQEKLIAKLAKFYGEHGIKIMLLKGYGLSSYYPKPEHRECGDIDIWLYGEQKKADKLLHEIKGVKIDEDEHHHTTFVIDGIMVENHYDFLNIHAHPSNREIETELKRLSREDKSIEMQIDDQTIYLPSANLNALFNLRHAASHFAAAEINIRHLLDWSLLIQNNSKSIDWQWLYKIAREQNMEKFLNSLNAISIEYFGLEKEALPEFERNRELEQRVLNDIISPEFSEGMPTTGFVKRLMYRYRRWWANRWKHRIVYREGLLYTFFVQIYSHLLKPKTLK
jgi:hypothetical protein